VSFAVMQAALDDPTYAHNLLICRSEPVFLKHLLAHPPKRPAMPSPEQVHTDQSNLALIARASKALARWAKTGFSVVDDKVLERRENACLDCPNLVAPTKLLQKLVASHQAVETIGQRTGHKICDLCGCNVSKKIRLSTESCPAKHPTQPGMTRWSETREIQGAE
jgi:hypothetical protein